MTTKTKQRIYYIIETEEKFIKEICSPIYGNTFILEVKSIADDRTFLKVKGSKSYQLYEVKVEDLNRVATLKHIYNIILN